MTRAYNSEERVPLVPDARRWHRWHAFLAIVAPTQPPASGRLLSALPQGSGQISQKGGSP